MKTQQTKMALGRKIFDKVIINENPRPAFIEKFVKQTSSSPSTASRYFQIYRDENGLTSTSQSPKDSPSHKIFTAKKGKSLEYFATRAKRNGFMKREGGSWKEGTVSVH